MGNKKPSSLSGLTQSYLQNLTADEYTHLRREFYERELTRTGSEQHAHNVVRRIKRLRQPYGALVLFKKQLLGYQPRASALLNAILPSRLEKWIAPGKRKKEISVNLTNFSLIDHPENTMKCLANLVLAEATAADTRLNFVANDVTDIAPYLILGIMRNDMMPFMSGGNITDPVRQILDAVQLSKFLGISRLSRRPGLRSDVIPLYPFTLRRRIAGSSKDPNIATSSSTKEKVTEDFVTTIDGWLSKLQRPRELTTSSKWRVARLIGETLDNAERHSRSKGDGEWTIAGFMVQRLASGVTRYTCHLAIVSVGATMAESISLADEVTKRSLARYRERHQHVALTAENAATIFALQDGISRIPQGEDLSAGGVGMMEIVTMANALGGSADSDPTVRPHVTVLSGNTLVQFAGKYENGVMFPDGRRFQWFNSSNSLDYPPDGRHVFSIRERFPGTVIAVRFAFDEKFLQDNTQ